MGGFIAMGASTCFASQDQGGSGHAPETKSSDTSDSGESCSDVGYPVPVNPRTGCAYAVGDNILQYKVPAKIVEINRSIGEVTIQYLNTKDCGGEFKKVLIHFKDIEKVEL